MTAVVPTSGRVLFARYAYPPNELGYCGTGDGDELLGVAAGTVGGEVVDRRAGGFDGAWAYLDFLADAAGGADPLDERVVEAYWLGNDLLDSVDPVQFARAVRTRFADQPGADWGCLDASPAPPPVPHHSFHVLAVYPWINLLRRGVPGPALTVLDRCRIRWGEVVDIDGDHVEVRSRRLEWRRGVLDLGAPRSERARVATGGRALAGGVRCGDRVALHWDWVCDILSEGQLTALQRATARQLEATNASSAANRARAKTSTRAGPGTAADGASPSGGAARQAGVGRVGG